VYSYEEKEITKNSVNYIKPLIWRQILKEEGLNGWVLWSNWSKRGQISFSGARQKVQAYKKMAAKCRE
jgi:hypothetical protein